MSTSRVLRPFSGCHERRVWCFHRRGRWILRASHNLPLVMSTSAASQSSRSNPIQSIQHFQASHSSRNCKAPSKESWRKDTLLTMGLLIENHRKSSSIFEKTQIVQHMFFSKKAAHFGKKQVAKNTHHNCIQQTQNSKPKSWNIMIIKQIDRNRYLKPQNLTKKGATLDLRPSFLGHNFFGVQTLEITRILTMYSIHFNPYL